MENSAAVNTSDIKDAFINEAIKSALFYDKHVDEHQVKSEVEQFFQQINAPDGLRGFRYVCNTLLNLLDAKDSGLHQQLGIRDYLVDTLRVDLQEVLSKSAFAHYTENYQARNWAKTNPLYLVLFGASGLKNSAADLSFLSTFIGHFALSKQVLEDPEFQTTDRTRSEEVGRAIRTLQHKNFTEFDAQLLQVSTSGWPAAEVALALELFEQNNSMPKGTSRYVKTLIKFFSNGWTKAKLRGRIGPQKNRRQGGGSRNSIRPELIVGQSEVTPKLLQLDEQGIGDGDVEILRSHLSKDIEEESDREEYERNSIGAIFDKNLQKARSIDITRDVRHKNNLNTSSRLLLSAASLSLLKKLCRNRLQKVEDNETVLAIYCMLATGISLTNLVSLKLYSDPACVENGIIIKAGQCYWRFKHKVSASTPVGHPEYFHHSDPWVMTPCSEVVTDYILTSKVITVGSKLFRQSEQQLRKRIEKLLQRTTEIQKTPYISITMIESFLSRFTEAADTIDPVVLDLSYQQELYTTRVSRSYVNLCCVQRIHMLDKLWKDIALYCRDATVSEYFKPGAHPDTFKHRTGSRFVPTASFCNSFVQQLQADLLDKKPEKTLALDSIVRYHNAYIRYTGWMLNFGTGYRAVYNPLPSFALHVPELQLLSISDKDDGNFSHSRVVALANTLNLQLTYLKKHLFRLAQLVLLFSKPLYQQVRCILEMDTQVETMTSSGVKTWFTAIRNSRTQVGPLFYLDDELQARPVSPTWLKTGNGAFQSLPANMGRHWLKTSLIGAGINSELINFQLGHWHEGQSPLYEYSAMSITDCVEELAPRIEQLLSKQGWRACQSNLF